MFHHPRKIIVPLAVLAAALIAVSAVLGSSGRVDGDPSSGQQVANVTMPLAILTVIAIATVALLHLVTRRAARPEG